MPVRSGTDQSGVGLLEFMIALMIFSIAALGLAAMQLAAKRNTYEATQRSIAISLGADVLERMRSNPIVLAAYTLNDLDAIPSEAGPQCQSDSCAPAQLAASDLYQWRRMLQGHSALVGESEAGSAIGGLNSPRACIRMNGRVVTVAIVWRGMNALANPAASSCGESAGLYGPKNSWRRLLLLTTYIGNA
jgi:type IV pilus assembly protein PilV